MIQTIEYQPKGVCSRLMVLSIDDEKDVITDFNVVGGCSGNLAGIRRLIIGMSVQDVADKLAGTTCGFKNTSCPDQLSLALKSYLARKENAK